MDLSVAWLKVVLWTSRFLPCTSLVCHVRRFLLCLTRLLRTALDMGAATASFCKVVQTQLPSFVITSCFEIFSDFYLAIVLDSLCTRLGQWGMTSYMYAPKDDAKHRSLWRIPYTASEEGSCTVTREVFFVHVNRAHPIDLVADAFVSFGFVSASS